MAISFNPLDILSGFNLTKLNQNFQSIKTSLSDGLSRSGGSPNQMEADIDMNSNDLLNVKQIDAEVLTLNGDILQPVDIATALKASNALSEIAALGLQATARANLGLGNSSTLNVGTTAGTVAAGDDSRIVNAIQPDDVYISLNNYTGDDNAKFTSAIADAAALSNGATVFVPRGTYSITQKTVPANVKILLDKGAVIQASGATASLFLFTGGLSGISGGLLINPSALATDAIIIAKTASNTSCEVEGIFFSQFTNAVKVNSGDCIKVLNCTGVSNTLFVRFADDGRNSIISRNYVLGGNGVHFQKVTQGAEGVYITKNWMLPSTTGTFCVNLQCGLEIVLDGNIFDQIVTGPGIQVDGQTNACQNIKVINNWIGRQAGAATADYGLYVVGNVRGLISENNTYVGFRQAGLNMNGLAGGVMLYNKSVNDHFYIADPCVRDIQLTFCENVEVKGTKFSGTASLVENGGVTGRVDMCDWSASTRPASVLSGLRYGRQLAGMVLRNKGLATIVGQTVTVTHGLNYTPSAQDISIEANEFPSNAPGEFVSDTIGATTFRAVARNNVGASDCDIKWEVDMER